MAIKDKILSANDVKQSAEMYKTMKSSLNEKKDRDGGKMWTSLVTGGTQIYPLWMAIWVHIAWWKLPKDAKPESQTALGNMVHRIHHELISSKTNGESSEIEHEHDYSCKFQGILYPTFQYCLSIFCHYMYIIIIILTLLLKKTNGMIWYNHMYVIYSIYIYR